MTSKSRGSERSYAPFTDEHLERLAAIARSDLDDLFQRKQHLAVYRDRILLIALCQGAAQHYTDCLSGVARPNGVKDLDVYCFLADHPTISWPYRRHVQVDFGESEFGFRPADGPVKGRRLVGRHVDLMGRALPVEPSSNAPAAVRDWLATRNETPKRLRQKAIVGLYPRRHFAKVIWP